jgi:hypothetical protein
MYMQEADLALSALRLRHVLRVRGHIGGSLVRCHAALADGLAGAHVPAHVAVSCMWLRRDQHSRAALSSVQLALRLLGLSIDTQLTWGAGALAGTVAFTIIASIGMLGLGVGRCMLAYTADRTGATRMGGRLVLWLWLCAGFIVCWLLLTLWLLAVLLGECLWLAGAWALTVAIKVRKASCKVSGAHGVGWEGLHHRCQQRLTSAAQVGSAAAQSSREAGLGNTTISYVSGA